MSSLGHYLKEIKKFPLLSRKEEVNLARRAERGNEKATSKLIGSNLRLVVYIARKYDNKEIELSELICAGNEGLIHAVEKYDWRKGKLSTYAYLSIKNKIINKSKEYSWNNRLSVEQINDFIEEKPKDEIEERINEICEYLEFPEKVIENVYLKKYVNQFIEAISTSSPREILEKKEEKRRLYKALSKLEPREQEVLKRSFGLGNYKRHSLEKIAVLMNVKRERIRQIKENAEKKLKIVLSKRNI